MLMWFLACMSQNEGPKLSKGKQLKLVYGNNMDGEIEPCG